MEKLNNSFIVVIPTYNARNLIEPAIRSVIGQKFDNLGLIIRDDLSTDGTPEVIENMLGIDGQSQTYTKYLGRDVLFLRNQRKFFATGNVYDSVVNHVSNKEAIIGILDGDDMLMDLHALSKVSQVYLEKKVWMVWSQHQPISQSYSKGSGCSAPLPPDSVIYSTRQYWAFSHFRTFKAWLFDHLLLDDLKDPFEQTDYYQMSGDAAFAYALAEMCANQKAYFLDEILYLYNDNLVLNDHNVDHDRQRAYAEYIRQHQRPYKLLNRSSSFPSPNLPLLC